jgi:hypothetical protein
MSKGPGTWQREILRTTAGVHTVTIHGIVRARLPEPSRDAFVAARRGAKGLALAGRVSAYYAYACQRCGQVQDHDPEQCCGRVRPMLAVSRPGKQLAHPAPAPGGVAPRWINVVPPPPPTGQLPVPTAADLAALVLRRCWDGLQSGAPVVPVRDAVAILRLAHEIEHDAALAERDAARRQMEEWRQELKSGLWAVRSVLVGQYGPDAWAAFSAELKKLRPAAPP